jgi:hypothetical protein
MADYPRFPKITPNIGDSSDTFTVGSPGPYGLAAPTKTVSFAKASSINGGAQSALTQMEQWADSLNDKLSADQVQIRNSVQQDQFGSISIRGRLRLNSNSTNPDTAESTPLKGQIRFNAATNKFQGYDGTGWRDFH